MHRIAEERYSRVLDTAAEIHDFFEELRNPSGDREFCRPLVARVIGNTKFLRCDYIDANREVTNGRNVKPLRLELRGNFHYSAGYCTLRLAERTFKLGNMTNVCETRLIQVE
jgi:predicted DNA-binding transcriptional regulator YafY